MSFTVGRYRSKPVEIVITEPITADNAEAIRNWIIAQGGNAVVMPPGYTGALVVYTESGHHDALFGDYVAKGLRGEIYPIKPEVVADKYEPA